MERRLSLQIIEIRLRLLFIIFSSLFIFSCADPVSAYVVKKEQQNIRKEFDSINATLVKADSVINKSNLKTMQAFDSLNKVYFDSNAKQ